MAVNFTRPENHVRFVKLAFHDADTDADKHRHSRRHPREDRRLAAGITSVARVGHDGEDPCEEVGVGVGVVECDL